MINLKHCVLEGTMGRHHTATDSLVFQLGCGDSKWHWFRASTRGAYACWTRFLAARTRYHAPVPLHAPSASYTFPPVSAENVSGRSRASTGRPSRGVCH